MKEGRLGNAPKKKKINKNKVNGHYIFWSYSPVSRVQNNTLNCNNNKLFSALS